MLESIEFLGNMCLLGFSAILMFYAIKGLLAVIECLSETFRGKYK